MSKYIVITTCLTPIRPFLVENEPCQAFSLSFSCHPSFHNNEIHHQVHVHHNFVTPTLPSLNMLFNMVDNPMKPPTGKYETEYLSHTCPRAPFSQVLQHGHLKKSKALTHTMTTNPLPRHYVLKIYCSAWSITTQNHQHLPLCNPVSIP